MNKIITLLVIGVLSFSIKPVMASDSQYDITIKSNNEFAEADREMNKVYKQVLKDYAKDKEFIDKFIKAQVAWLKYRDAYIESIYPKKDKLGNYGSAYRSCYALTMISLTQDRTKQLKEWIEGIPEGDVCGGSVKIIK